ncbi:hypothetical protein QBC33DRAFT_88849 [Phialemonium atrogriseum]|uniref:Uncharacterized protein n=1 Tax=Phialemonium atrogriseum TaxID=1093897 RepID=A0AAJ0C172_9PEZI|nr:uncharacterized protein QBC33DRAFT_88849 [Phialemonium atrogriseum]KAK1766792.1 hypothetical protein QBC33DRAFT_88849 [Phialemonium atrogriseum]
MKDALEHDVKDDEVYICLVSAASMYILCSGQALFVQLIQAVVQIWPEGAEIRKPGPLFSGASFGLERWEFWKGAFVAAVGRKGVEKGPAMGAKASLARRRP